MGVEIGDIFFFEVDSSFGRFKNPGEGEEQGGLSRPVGTDEGNGLSTSDFKGDLLESRQRAVMDSQFFYLKHWALKNVSPKISPPLGLCRNGENGKNVMLNLFQHLIESTTYETLARSDERM
jgi:hypothetical protein